MTWISTVKDFVCRHMLRHMIRLAYVLGSYAAIVLVSAALHIWLLLFLVPVEQCSEDSEDTG